MVKAVGECGLDYCDACPRDHAAQTECFRAQVDLAVDLGLPLFLHEREAMADFLAVLDAYPR